MIGLVLTLAFGVFLFAWGLAWLAISAALSLAQWSKEFRRKFK